MLANIALRPSSIQKKALDGAFFTVGTYGLSVILRFGSNVILSRLVTPEVFGIMLVITTMKIGMEMISDVGLGQNIVHSPRGAEASFYNTAWTVKILRGLFLFALFAACSYPLAYYYSLPPAAFVLGAVTVGLSGFASTSLYLLQRELSLGKLNLFDLSIDVIGACLVIASALVSPTIWSLLVANIAVTAIRTLATHLIARNRNRIMLNREHVYDILSFGKWIFLSSLLAFSCANFDKLYLSQSVPFAMLGLYGIARNIADLPVNLVSKLGHMVLFPLIASQAEGTRGDLREVLRSPRAKLLAVSAVSIAFGVSFADIAVALIYDDRYHQAGWMLSLALLGAWAAILCTINEYTLLGLGRPSWAASANAVKLGFMVVGMPAAMTLYGIQALIMAIALAEALRYIPIALGQRQFGLSFIKQDLLATLLMFVLIAGFLWLRQQTGHSYAIELMIP